MHQNHLKDLLKRRLLGPTPRVSESAGLGWELRICISNRFPSDAVAASLVPYFENIRVYLFSHVQSNCYILKQLEIILCVVKPSIQYTGSTCFNLLLIHREILLF